MRLPREPFSWDGEDEPIPLNEPKAGEAEIVQDAETVVREAQEELARQDTDPYMTIPPAIETGGELSGGPRTRSLLKPAVRRAAVAALLSASCLIAFTHGWATGARAGACGPTHCDDDRSIREYREERQR